MTTATEELRKLMSEATPGPWDVASDGRSTAIRKNFHAAHHMNVCGSVHGYMYADDEKAMLNANARLIAMAPTIAAELITARAKLEAAAKMAEAIMGMDDGWRGISDKARAALAAWEAAK